MEYLRALFGALSYFPRICCLWGSFSGNIKNKSDGAFALVALKLWNGLAFHIHNAQTLNMFKSIAENKFPLLLSNLKEFDTQTLLFQFY